MGVRVAVESVPLGCNIFQSGPGNSHRVGLILKEPRIPHRVELIPKESGTSHRAGPIRE
jgi:hypothetical protein